MYKVKGADNNEYGPISADQVRLWIRENRLNRQSLVENVDAPGWKTLGEFPEFADALGAPMAGTIPAGGAPGPAAYADPQTTRAAALSSVKGPAIAIMVWGWIYVAISLFGIVKALLIDTSATREQAVTQLNAVPDFPFKDGLVNCMGYAMAHPVLVNSLPILMGLLIAFGALQMLRLRHKWLAWIVVILVTQPCYPCCCLPTAFGIWAIVVLCKQEVKDSFE